MRYFREQGKNDHEVIAALDAKFGDNYQIMTRKTVKLGGIFGVGRRTGVEYFGYIKEKAISVAGSQLGRNSKAKALNEQDDAYRLGAASRNSGSNSANRGPDKLRATSNKSRTEGQSHFPAASGVAAGSRETASRRTNKRSTDGAGDKDYFPVSEEEQAERDQRNREDILARFAKNKEVQRLLREKKLIIENQSPAQPLVGPASNENIDAERDSGPGILPQVPHLDVPAQPPAHHAPAQPGSTSGMEGYGRADGSDRGQYSGVTPVYNPATAPPTHDPEYASVNYDILAASGRETTHWHAAQVPYAQPYDNQSHNYPGNFPPAAKSVERANDFGPQPRSEFRPEPRPGISERPDEPGRPMTQDMADSWHQNKGPIGPYPAQQRKAGYADYQKSHYSSESGSHYQRNLDQIEVTFLRRLENLERKLDRRGSMTEPSSLTQLRENLYYNEFPPFFVDRLASQMKRELPLEELEKLPVLWEYVLLHIAENMRFIDVQQQSHSRIMVLVGPTGVGKTTTIAKLAARQCVEAMGGSKKVHLITLDNYRIGAQDQIRTYGEILGAKVDCVETTEGLATCIAQDKESDMILIDTMGRSPSDHMKLSEMRRFLEYSGNCEIHLTMSATSGASAMKEIITQFKPFGFRSVILTKLDELGRIGGTLATFLQEDLPLSYVTTGQKVPQDIRPASALVLFQHLSEVQVDWQSFAQKLEENIF